MTKWEEGWGLLNTPLERKNQAKPPLESKPRTPPKPPSEARRLIFRDFRVFRVFLGVFQSIFVFFRVFGRKLRHFLKK